jgi:uncharacterized OB-fold protein
VTSPAPAPAPAPVPDADTAPFLDALREHRIVLQRCTVCDRVRFPPMPACPWCGATTATQITVTGEGHVYSWVGVHRALTAGYEGEVPYTIATVELREGARVFGRLEGPEPTAPGGAVRATFVDHADWTELRFRPADASA